MALNPSYRYYLTKRLLSQFGFLYSFIKGIQHFLISKYNFIMECVKVFYRICVAKAKNGTADCE